MKQSDPFSENIGHLIMRCVRKLYIKIFDKKIENQSSIADPDQANDEIYELLMSNKSCMIARYGGFELNILLSYLGRLNRVKNPVIQCLNYMRGKTLQWWWNPKSVQSFKNNAGFFPISDENLMKFGKLMMSDSENLDILGTCWPGEKYIQNLIEETKKIKLVFLEPWHSQRPWTRALKNKRVVVIHPFVESIASQYKRRQFLFDNQNVLPEFKSLRLVKAVQSIGGENDRFESWFEALEWMKTELDKEPYDIAIIGCGAYGFPLASYAKQTGHQGIHLGGATQLLFGIIGNRWINEYGMGDEYFTLLPPHSYSKLMNEYWIRPSSSETPSMAKNIEGGCYW